MTIFEEIKYSLIGQKPVTYKYFADGRRVLVEEDQNVRWFVRLIVRLIVLLLFLSLLRLFGFIPSDWQSVSNVTGLSRNGGTNGNSGANGAAGNTSGAGTSGNTGGANGFSGNDGGLMFGSGNTSTDGQPGTAIGGDGTTIGGNGVIGADGAPGPAGPAGPAGPPGRDGANGADGASGISNGQGSASIGTCDQNVKVELKSAWDFQTFSFKLEQVLVKNVSTACSNQTLSLLLLNSTSATVLSTITFNTGQIASPEGTITITRNQIGSVTSNQVSDIAFEISG